jgi:transcriptional regulator of acetoin/glycerol metabolism
MTAPLILADIDDSAWQAFESGRRVAADHAEHWRTWQRSRLAGAVSEDPRLDERVLGGALLREHVERLEPVAALGEAILARATALLAAHDFKLLVADAEGVIVAAAGGGRFEPAAREARLIAGACWSEATRGTNAIGTALAEQRSVVVAGRAHYARCYRELVCHAAPIVDHEGRLVGVLDATSHARHVDPAITAIVGATAAALSDLLRLRAWSLAGAGILHTLGRTLDRMNVPALLVEPPGRLSRCNALARELLVRGELPLDWAQLRAEALAPTPGGLVLEQGRQRVRVQVEPLGGQREPLGLLVIVEPLRSELAPTRARARSEPPTRVRRVGHEQADDAFAGIFGDDPRLCEALGRARSVARSRIPVVLVAETGAGKELVARAIHRASARAAGPFVALNCGSLAPSLLEAELFGHAPGAFTGASAKGRAGLLHAASGGTLFLDELAEMPSAMQAALLRVLESGEVLRVGSTQGEQVDVRIVCATCKDLPSMVARGEFRDDLYYRLKGLLLRLPPLRERSDRLALARHLLDELARQDGVPCPALTPAAEARLLAHRWPGNVRELRSTLALALALAGERGEIGPELLELDEAPAAPASSSPPAASLDAIEASAVERVLGEVAGNVSAAARKLGVARSTLYRMMQRHGLVKG